MKSVVANVLLLLCSLGSLPGIAQGAYPASKVPAGASATVALQGKVADAVTKRPIEFATVVMLRAAEQVAVATCDADGSF